MINNNNNNLNTLNNFDNLNNLNNSNNSNNLNDPNNNNLNNFTLQASNSEPSLNFLLAKYDPGNFGDYRFLQNEPNPEDTVRLIVEILDPNINTNNLPNITISSGKGKIRTGTTKVKHFRDVLKIPSIKIHQNNMNTYC